jgi:hypothetical protein
LARLPEVVQPTTAQARPVIASYHSDQSEQAVFLLASDQSLFSNGMLWHGDNSLLAINVCRKFASQGRSKLLFIVDGKVQTSFRNGPAADQLPPPPPSAIPPIPPPVPDAIPPLTAEQMVLVANQVVERIEDSDLHNELAANQPRNMPQFRYERILWLVLGFFSLFFILSRLLMRSRQPVLPMPQAAMRFPRPLAAAHLVGSLPRDSRKLGEYAQRIVRDSLQRLTRSSDPLHWGNFIAQHLSLATNSSHIATPSLSDIAKASEPPQLDLRSLQRVLETLRELEAAADRTAKQRA